MEGSSFRYPVGRREFLKESARAAIFCGLSPMLLCKARPASALSCRDLEESCEKIAGRPSWKACPDLSRAELEKFKMDLTPWDKTPRHGNYNYIAAKLEAPYTATEIAYMLTVGQHFAWWTHEGPMGGMMINNRGGVNHYTGQREVWSALTPDTLEDYLYRWPENKVYMWIWDRYYTPIRTRYDKLLQNVYRCGATHEKYSDKWEFVSMWQKTNLSGETRYSDQYWDRDFTYGDTMLIPWYYSWRYLGTDTLSSNDTVRFPDTREEISIRSQDGKVSKRDTRSIRIMGDDYPAYTEEGGVPCYVLEGVANSDFFVPRHRRLILWVDMHACRELRRERYDLNNDLVAVMETKNRLELKNTGKWGYSILIYLAWDLKNDHMSVNHYDFHRHPRTFKVDPENPEAYFRPNPIAMTSQMFPVPLSAMAFRDPEEFYLRPKLMPEKFPRARKIQLPEKLLTLVRAQNRKRQLVFV